ISTPAAGVDQPADRTIVRTGDWDWINAHASGLFRLSLQPQSLGDPTTNTAPSLSPRRTTVSAWLAGVGEGDPSLPDFVAPGSPNCISMSPTDCFDVQSIAMLLLNGMVSALHASVDPPAGGGPDPNLLVRAVGGDFSISFVPNVVHPGMNQDARRTRGIG